MVILIAVIVFIAYKLLSKDFREYVKLRKAKEDVKKDVQEGRIV
jgi:hypothetical protein